MLELFRLDAVIQIQALNDGLLALERAPTAADQLEGCMRAAHSLKGAASVVGLTAAVGVAHAMEDCFVAAQRGRLVLRRESIDLLLQGSDLLNRIAYTPEADLEAWGGAKRLEIDAFLAELRVVLQMSESAPVETPVVAAVEPVMPRQPDATPLDAVEPREPTERAMYVTAENLNRLLGVAGESLVESRWLKPFSASLLRLKRQHDETAKAWETLREVLPEQAPDGRAQMAIADVHQRVRAFHSQLTDRLAELESFENRSTNLAHRLYGEALACRMRPFTDGVRAFPRMVRDVARSLGKEARLEIVGETTRVDRDILEKLDAPVGHLLRNAIDHGIESPDERRAAGKSVEAVVRLEARHSAGMLQIIVSDDGRGVDVERLRIAVVERALTNAQTAAKLSEAELLEFLFLPGFTMKDAVTEISGRGVGLDVVQNMVKAVRGTIRISSQSGKGVRFQLQLPLSLSVVRTLLVDVGGEPYALPLAYIVRTLRLSSQHIEMLEGRQLFDFDGRWVGLVSAHQLLLGGEHQLPDDDLPVIVVGTPENMYGLVADHFLGERDLVVQPLDKRLGKIKNIAAGGLMEDGSPVLIVDVEDTIRSMEKLSVDGRLRKVRRGDEAAKRRKRILVVDDSLTVREMERKLLDNSGYDVEVAVDGMEGWNAVRTGHFDLVITDIDMPRMDGIELVTLIKKDATIASLPVMIVSYKDREEDRARGLAAGADYYLTKGSFHDETLLQAVVDLVGEAGT